MLTENPAQKGQEWRTRADVVSASAAKLTATMRHPRVICDTPSANKRRFRALGKPGRDRAGPGAVPCPLLLERPGTMVNGMMVPRTATRTDGASRIARVRPVLVFFFFFSPSLSNSS